MAEWRTELEAVNKSEEQVRWVSFGKINFLLIKVQTTTKYHCLFALACT